MFADGGLKDIIGQEMAKEREALQDKILDLQQNLAKATQNDTSEEVSWADSYKKWDCYEDTDELEAEIDAAKKALSKLDDKIKNHNHKDTNKPCNHSHRCSCSGNKSAERKVVAMKTSERLDQMTVFKKEGNALFAQKNFKDSIALYEKALIYFEYCFDGTDEERKLADTLRLQCLLNASACFLHLKIYAKCVEYCNEALEIDADNVDSRHVKALYRRSVAHRAMDDVDAARADLRTALKVDPNNSTLKKELVAIKITMEKQNAKEKARFQQAFSKGEYSLLHANDSDASCT
ncbi:hypothetical protein ACHAXR_012233 [Thalassiosira sp. AJA248-18]